MSEEGGGEGGESGSVEIMKLTAKVIFDAQKAVMNMMRYQKKQKDLAKKQNAAMKKNQAQTKKWKMAFDLVLKAGQAFWKKMVSSSPALQVQLELIGWHFYDIFRVLGDLLVPVFQKVLEGVKKFRDWFNKLSPTIKKSISFIGLLGGALAVIAPIFMILAAIGFKIIAIILLIIAVVYFLHQAWTNNWGGIRDFFLEIWEHIKQAWESLKPSVMELWETIKEFWETIKPIVMKVWELFKIYFMEKMKWAFDRLKLYWTWFVNHVKHIIGLITAIFKGDWKQAWEHFKGIFKNVWEYVKGWFAGLWERFKSFFNNLGKKLLEWGREAIGNWFKGLGERIGDRLRRFGQRIRDFFGFSLPKEGPLREVPKWGLHMGEQFMKGLDIGLVKSIPDVLMNNTLKATGDAPIQHRTSSHQTFHIEVPIEASVSGDADIRNLAEEVSVKIKEQFESRSAW